MNWKMLREGSMKALSLLSGGLDSRIATKLILDQGIEVIGVHYVTIFCTCTAKGCKKSSAREAAEQFGISLKEISINKEFLEMLKSPKYGYGSGMNPCIDCRILMFKDAKNVMEKIGARFIITGEVLGQRPMSQHRKALQIIERESGLEGLILRPLSARLLLPTIPEKEGWVDREKLLAHSGRSRREQIEIAEKIGVYDYPCAAGGCLLTDPSFSKRIKEAFDHGEYEVKDILLLKLGRHFRYEDKVKIIIGRHQAENSRMLGLAEGGDIILMPVDGPGPVGLIRRKKEDISNDIIKLTADICARYSKVEKLQLKIGIKEKNDIAWQGTIKGESILGYKHVEDRDDNPCRRI